MSVEQIIYARYPTYYKCLSNKSIVIDETIHTTTPSQCEPSSNDNDRVLHATQNSKTEASLSDEV